MADTIYLKNGRELAGLIEKETDTEVIISLGAGSATFNKTAIQKIAWSDDVERADIMAEWQRKYFSHGKYVPRGLEEFGKSFREVLDMRARALGKKRDIGNYRIAETRIRKEITDTEQELVEVTRALASQFGAEDLVKYNALVRRNNTLRARIDLKQKDLKANAGKISKAAKSIFSYQQIASDFDLRFKAVAGPELKGANKRQAKYFKLVAKELEKINRDFRQIEITASRKNNNILADVTINEKVTAKFLVDTGATVVSLSQELATKLGLPQGKTPVTVSMADGRKVSAQRVILSSVRVGDVLGENIEAVILPDAPGNEIDGLLGMSFLSKFHVRLDSATGKLILREFVP